jgi:hypothetical protein
LGHRGPTIIPPLCHLLHLVAEPSNCCISGLLIKMLKRQRPASPPASASAYFDDQDLFRPNYPVHNHTWATQASTSNSEMTETGNGCVHRKRRRTVAPSLDGHVRDQRMDMSLPSQSHSEDDDAEEDIDYEDSYVPAHEEQHPDQHKHAMKLYKETNSFLHDLHAEQQHRKLFSISHGGPSLIHDHHRQPSVVAPAPIVSHKLHPDPIASGSEEKMVKETYEDRNRYV